MPRPSSDKTTINMRFPRDLLEKLNGYAVVENGYPDRSSVISDAVDFFIHSKECVNCGTRNSEDGIYCSVCGVRLYTDDEIKALMECAFKYGLIVSSRTNYENHLEPIPCNPYYHDLVESINRYTEKGLEASMEPEIDRSYPYDDVRRYRFEVSFRLKDSDMEVLPKNKIEFYIPPEVFLPVMMDQFKKIANNLCGEEGVPSTKDLQIHTDFNKIQAENSVEALKIFQEQVSSRYSQMSKKSAETKQAAAGKKKKA